MMMWMTTGKGKVDPILGFQAVQFQVLKKIIMPEPVVICSFFLPWLTPTGSTTCTFISRIRERLIIHIHIVFGA